MIISDSCSLTDSALVAPPQGCSVWSPAEGYVAVVLFTGLSNINSSECGVGKVGFKCLCAPPPQQRRCTYVGTLNNSIPGNFELHVSKCDPVSLSPMKCDSDAGYERAWDSKNSNDVCRLSLAHLCQTANVRLRAQELANTSTSSMVAKIHETSALTMRLAAGQSVGSSTRVEMRPIQAVLADTGVDGNGQSKFALNTSGTFELHIVDGDSSCKLPSRLDVICKDGYAERNQACVQQQVCCACNRYVC